jgi:hypothetical protein
MDSVKIYDSLNVYLIQDISKIIIDYMYHNTHLQKVYVLLSECPDDTTIVLGTYRDINCAPQVVLDDIIDTMGIYEDTENPPSIGEIQKALLSEEGYNWAYFRYSIKHHDIL